jgi:hypothetical protein
MTRLLDRDGAEIREGSRGFYLPESQEVSIATVPAEPNVAAGIYLSAWGEEGPVGLLARPTDEPNTYRCPDLLVQAEEESR